MRLGIYMLAVIATIVITVQREVFAQQKGSVIEVSLGFTQF